MKKFFLRFFKRGITMVNLIKGTFYSKNKRKKWQNDETFFNVTLWCCHNIVFKIESSEKEVQKLIFVPRC